MDDTGVARVWAASTDGHIYSFGTSPGNTTDYGTRMYSAVPIQMEA